MAQSHKDAAVQFLELVVLNKVREAYERYIGAGFRHHNPFFRGDAASLMEGMEQNAAKNPNKILEIQCVIEEGDRVAVFSRIRQNPDERGGAVVHIFRFDKDHIVELWDIGQTVPEPCVNENGMF